MKGHAMHLEPADISPQSLRALYAYLGTRGEEPLRDMLVQIHTALANGHGVEIRIFAPLRELVTEAASVETSPARMAKYVRDYQARNGLERSTLGEIIAELRHQKIMSS